MWIFYNTFILTYKASYFLLITSLVAQMAKNLPAIWETQVWSLGWEHPLEEGMATHSSVFAWRILVDRGGHKESDMTEQLSTQHWQPLRHPSCHWLGCYIFETSLGTLPSQPLCWFVSFSTNTMYHGMLNEIRIVYFMVHCIKLSFLRVHLLLTRSVVSDSLRPHGL